MAHPANVDVGRLEAFQALRHATFRRIWIAFVMSQAGDWMQITARAYLVFAITGSASALGTIYLVSYAPHLLFALAGGALADRISRRAMAIIGNSLLLVLAIAFGVLAATDTATLLNLSVLSFAAGVVQTVQSPAGMALLPTLVPRRDLPSAVSLQGTATSITRVIGPLVAGALIPLIGVDWLFFLNAATFLFPIWAWAVTSVPRPPPPEDVGGLAMIVRGLRHVRATRTLLVPIVALAFLSAIGIAYQPLGVAYATNVLAHGEKALGGSYYGYLQAAIGIGSGIGIVSLIGVGRRRPAATVIWTGIGFSVSLLALGFVSSLWIALLVIGALGAMHFANAMLIVTIAQHEAEEHLRGRIMSIVNIAWIGLLPFTSQLFGWLADLASVNAVFVGAGAACLLFSVTLMRWRGHIRMLHPDDADPDSQLLAYEVAAEEG